MTRTLMAAAATTALLLSLGSGPASTVAAEPVQAPAPAEIVLHEPAPAIVSSTVVAPLDDGSGRMLITETVSNHPIPDSPASRAKNGGPESAGGRATAAQSGPVMVDGKVKAPAAEPVVPPAETPVPK